MEDNYYIIDKTEEVIGLLLENKVNVDQVDQSGNAAFHLAVSNYHGASAKNLLSLIKDTKLKNKQQQNALHLCAYSGNTDQAKWLIEKGLALHDTDNQGRTALEIAIKQGHQELFNFLLTPTLKKINSPHFAEKLLHTLAELSAPDSLEKVFSNIKKDLSGPVIMKAISTAISNRQYKNGLFLFNHILLQKDQLSSISRDDLSSMTDQLKIHQKQEVDGHPQLHADNTTLLDALLITY